MAGVGVPALASIIAWNWALAGHEKTTNAVPT